MKKFTWGHGVALALFSFMGFILYLIFIFPSGMQNENSELVTENYYEDELDYQKIIDAKKNAEGLSQKPFFAQLPYGIRIAFPEDMIDANTQVSFELYHTSDKTKDKTAVTPLDAQHSFLISKELMTPGSYTLKVKWNKAGTNYQVDYDLQWK